MLFAVGAVTSSNKRNSLDNEDRYVVSELSLSSSSSYEKAVLVSIFDGHGGSSVADHLKKQFPVRFETILMSKLGDYSLWKEIGNIFSEIDTEIYRKNKVARKKILEEQQVTCTCPYGEKEVLCPCFQKYTSIQSRCGSTATNILLLSEPEYLTISCSNVGDSEAILVSSRNLLSSCAEEKTDVSIDLFLYEYLGLRVKEVYKKLKFEIWNLFSSENRLVYPQIKGKSKPKNYIQELTRCHSPDLDICPEEYFRLLDLRNVLGKEEVGLKRTSNSNVYVVRKGSHSVNMTRAFGNLGQKKFKSDGKMEKNYSSILSEPNTFRLKIAEEQIKHLRFIVCGSDGLWNNLTKQEVSVLIEETIRMNIEIVKEKIKYMSNVELNMLKRFPEKSIEGTVCEKESTLILLAEICSKNVLNKALTAKKKKDDITLSIILFESCILCL
eukprot:snap_masked-scaffold_26-processed-gene-0.21-mRNA-1 protein AED:1.00 eAED:1.00 QI:0/-1/0/0/-1/1/1/0/439